MEVDDDNIDPEIPKVKRDEQEMMTIALLANEIYFNPVRYLPKEVKAVEQLVNKIEKPIPEPMCTLEGMFNLFVYSTLLFFISEGFVVLPVDGRTNYPKNDVPDDWLNATIRLVDPVVASSDLFTDFKLLMRNRLYVVRFILRVVSQEVEIIFCPYSDGQNLIVDEMYPWRVTLNTEIAKFFVLRDRWLHFGFYLRYNMKKVFSTKIRRAQGHSSQFASRANAPDLRNISTT